MTNVVNNTQTLNTCIMSDLVPLSKFGEFFKFPSVGAIRQYIFYSDKYKFHNVYKRVGNRLYISISAFNEWVENQNKTEKV